MTSHSFPPNSSDPRLPAITPDRVLGVGFGFFAAKTLMTAVEFGVFTELSFESKTSLEVQIKLNFHPRGTADFLDALVALKFLEKDGKVPARATGTAQKQAVERYPHLKSIAFDLPEVAAIARESLTKWGVADRVSVVEGSFLTDPLPAGADLITLGNILHDWNLEKKKQILTSVYKALQPGGCMVVIENLIDDGRRENAFGLLMSLNMLIEFGDAFDSTFADLESWCREIGFVKFERRPIHGPCSALVAFK